MIVQHVFLESREDVRCERFEFWRIGTEFAAVAVIVTGNELGFLAEKYVKNKAYVFGFIHFCNFLVIVSRA